MNSLKSIYVLFILVYFPCRNSTWSMTTQRLTLGRAIRRMKTKTIANGEVILKSDRPKTASNPRWQELNLNTTLGYPALNNIRRVLTDVNLDEDPHGQETDAIPKVNTGGIKTEHANVTTESQPESVFEYANKTDRKRRGETKITYIHDLSWEAALGLLTFCGTVFVVLWICICYKEEVERRERKFLRQESIRRQQVRNAVRAKIAEMEGLEEADSMRWYMEQRDPPLVRFGSVIEISPEHSTNPSVSVLYHPADNTDPSQLKRIDINIQQIMETLPSPEMTQVNGGPGEKAQRGPSITTVMNGDKARCFSSRRSCRFCRGRCWCR